MSDCNSYGGGNCGSTPTTVVVVPSTGPKPSTPANDLPFTGADVFGGLMLGIGALAGGIALMRSGRRKAA